MRAPIKILPVIDLLGGQVVHAVRGDRANYQPLRTPFAAGSHPADVASGLRLHFGFQTYYVADLDAIQGRSPNHNAIADLLESRFKLWLDAGISGLADAASWGDFQVAGRKLQSIVVGLESLRRAAELVEIARCLTAERVVFSLDLKKGRPLHGAGDWNSPSVYDLARTVAESGIRRWIVLDLASVGANDGTPTLQLCRWIRDRFPDSEITSGGGVRGLEDIHRLASAGCDWALVATAIHQQRLQASELAPFRE